MNKLKELIGKLNPERGFIVEEIEWENCEGELVTAIAVSNKKAPGGYILEEAKIAVKTIVGERFNDGYKIFEVSSGTDNDTGSRWEDYREIAQVTGEYGAVTELAALFAKNDIDQELYVIEQKESARLAEEYHKEMGK